MNSWPVPNCKLSRGRTLFIHVHHLSNACRWLKSGCPSYEMSQPLYRIDPAIVKFAMLLTCLDYLFISILYLNSHGGVHLSCQISACGVHIFHICYNLFFFNSHFLQFYFSHCVLILCLCILFSSLYIFCDKGWDVLSSFRMWKLSFFIFVKEI